jgi:ABC-type multidrug transport system fused ATPase/permease subunit
LPFGRIASILAPLNTYLEAAKFSRVYLSRYWFRFVAGIVLGVLFGVSNGIFIGSVYMMVHRLSDPDKVEQVTEQGREAKKEAAAQKEAQDEPTLHNFKTLGTRLKEDLYVLVDPWLPRNEFQGDKLRPRPLDWKQCVGCILFLPLLAALRGFLGYGSSYLLAWSGQRITNDVKLDAFRKVSSLSLDFFHKITTGELINRVENDAVGLNNFLKLGMSDLVKEPVTIVSILGMMLLLDWKFTVVSLIFLPLCLIPTRRISQRLKMLGRQDFNASVGQSNIAMESFQNVRITKAYGLETAHAEVFRNAAKRSAYYNIKSLQSREMLNPIVQTLSALGIGAVLLYAIWMGTSAELPAFIAALILFYTPFKKMNGLGVYLTQLSLSLERLMALFRFEPTVKEDPNPLPLARFSQGLEFKNVSFSYGDGPVLRGISFMLPRGKRLGLAGESGSGKSSLLNLLFRFYDATDGHIEVDGVGIERYRIADLRMQLALVSQDVLLFNATVADNIGYGKIGATRGEIEEAARRAHASDFIAALPQGYDTPLGERGIRLSGGQRQRIAIARAFVRNSPILVLDEATASLDSKSESEVQGAIDELAENRTVICVAHRLSTLRGMDEILVMDQGRIVERGSFDELLHRRAVFAAMAARQSIFHPSTAPEPMRNEITSTAR